MLQARAVLIPLFLLMPLFQNLKDVAPPLFSDFSKAMLKYQQATLGKFCILYSIIEI